MLMAKKIKSSKALEKYLNILFKLSQLWWAGQI
jgi:hypothetical protein